MSKVKSKPKKQLGVCDFCHWREAVGHNAYGDMLCRVCLVANNRVAVPENIVLGDE